MAHYRGCGDLLRRYGGLLRSVVVAKGIYGGSLTRCGDLLRRCSDNVRTCGGSLKKCGGSFMRFGGLMVGDMVAMV